jgi:hypothetical protein
MFPDLLAKTLAMAKEKTLQTAEKVTGKLFSDITSLVNEARNRVAITVNRQIPILNWNIGIAIIITS